VESDGQGLVHGNFISVNVFLNVLTSITKVLIILNIIIETPNQPIKKKIFPKKVCWFIYKENQHRKKCPAFAPFHPTVDV
jgi:hypothetical protein